MKKILATSLIVISLALPSISYAKDPCASVLCLAGMLQGAGKSSACSGPISDYFSIRKFKKGKFRPDKTFSKRSSYLGSCPSGGAWNNKINNRFGKLFNG